MNKKTAMYELPFELPRDVTRVWDLDVPIIVDEETGDTTVYLTTAIEEPYIYNEICFMLDNAKAGEKFYLNVNTPGGIIDSAFMLANSIECSKATVIANLSGTVASAGTLISMACDQINVGNYLSFMVHNYSGGMVGKGHEMKARQNFTDEQLNAAFKSFYAGFLTGPEMNNVIEGQDMWMGSDEVVRRWNNRIEYSKGKK